jgi:transcriptional regulator with XRE-family HTH domain
MSGVPRLSSSISRGAREISRRGKLIQIEVEDVARIHEILRQRVQELLDQHPDVDKRTLTHRIGRPAPSFLSMFLRGHRRLNDLEVVARIAKFFRVPIGYLLNELEPPHDAQTTLLLGAWQQISDAKDRKAVLAVAQSLAPDDADEGAEGPIALRPAEPSEALHTNGTHAPTPHRTRRRSSPSQKHSVRNSRKRRDE